MLKCLNLLINMKHHWVVFHQRCKSPVCLLVIGIKWNLVEPYRAKWFVIVTWQLNHDNSNANEDWWLWISISVICNAYLFSICMLLNDITKEYLYGELMSKLCMIKWTLHDIQSMCTNEVVALKIIRGLCQMWNGEKVLYSRQRAILILVNFIRLQFLCVKSYNCYKNFPRILLFARVMIYNS